MSLNTSAVKEGKSITVEARAGCSTKRKKKSRKGARKKNREQKRSELHQLHSRLLKDMRNVSDADYCGNVRVKILLLFLFCFEKRAENGE